ncbi:hypothetical protein [Streptococcus equi]
MYARQFQYGGKRRGFTRWTLPGGKNTVYLCIYICKYQRSIRSG